LRGAGGCDGVVPVLAPAREAIAEESAEGAACVGGCAERVEWAAQGSMAQKLSRLF
jgi:hypothetical protein